MFRAQSRVLLLVTAVAVGFSLWESRGQTFFSDEWSRWITYPERSFEYSLHGASGHLIIGQIWLYRAVLEVFGAGSYLPHRLLAAGLLVGLPAESPRRGRTSRLSARSAASRVKSRRTAAARAA